MNIPERMTGAVEATEEKLKNYYQDMIYTEGSRVARFISSILTMIPIAAFMRSGSRWPDFWAVHLRQITFPDILFPGFMMI